jgi:hypothetical protein
MTSYRISFLNELTNDTGHIFHCCQGVIDIRRAKTKERALEAAKRRFARKEKIGHWSHHAASVELEEIQG